MSGRRNVGVLAGATAATVAVAALVAYATITPSTPEKLSTPTPAPAPAPPSVAAAETPPPKPSEPAAPAAPTRSSVNPPSASGPAGQTPDLTAVPLDDLRARAAKNDLPAMDELGRRLLQGIDVAKDPQAGAGWLLRAAEQGSASSAFNIGVMYERGFVVERDSSKAADWYRKAADAGLPVAKHNLALLLRDGKGVPRDVNAAMRLLLSAANQGMAASMFTLGDIYEQGDGGTKDPAAALAWFAIAGEFERQTNRDADTALARTAAQRAQILKRTLTTSELERAQTLAQTQFKQIVSALSPPPPAAAPPALPPPPAPLDDAAIDWPKGAADQVRAVQQALIDLKLLRDKPDGNMGPLTRAAIQDFQKSIGVPQTGEPTRELYVALKSTRRDILSNSPLPTPPATQAAAPAKPAAPPAEVKIDLGSVEPPPPPPTSADVAAALPSQTDNRQFPAPTAVDAAKAAPPSQGPKVDPPRPAPVVIDTAKPVTPPVAEKAGAPRAPDNVVSSAPPPPASADITRSPSAPTADQDGWPTGHADQVKLIQSLLRDLRFYTKRIDGQASTGTRNAIRDYQRMAGLKETGEISKALFESLKQTRKLTVPAAN